MATTTGAKTPRKFKFDKKILAHTSAAIVGAALIIFGINQCSNKRDERALKEAAQRNLTEKQEQYIGATKIMEKAVAVIDSLSGDNQIKADSIIVLNDSIKVLNDSLDLTQRQLTDCRKSKKRPARPSVPAEKPQQAKPRVIDAVAAAPVNNETIIKLQDSVKNTGDVIVANGDVRGNNKTEITLGKGAENSGTIVVNNGGNVTVYGNSADSVKNDTAADKAQPQKQVDTLRAKVICVWTEKTRTWVR